MSGEPQGESGAGATTRETARGLLRERVELVERAYDFFLAYAAQGYDSDRVAGAGGELRDFLARLGPAIQELGPLLAETVTEEGLEPAERFHAFREVMEEDARKAAAAFNLVAACPSVSSQMVDNLNASVHIRALLTDLFLLDEVLELDVPDG
jgi:hypothetical protein